jgi:hypothetical protein
MHNFKNGHLIVDGTAINDLDFSSFHVLTDLSQWSDKFWIAFRAAVAEGHDVSFSEIDIKNVRRIEVLGAEFELLFNQAYERISLDESMKKPVVVDNKSYSIIMMFDVYHTGWDCDNKGYIVATDAGPKLVLTDHGTEYFASANELKSHIANYQDAIKDMQAAIGLIEPQ